MASTSSTFEFPTSLGGVDKLDFQHGDALTRAVLRLLDTDIAVEAYSQIIDGVPLCSVACAQQDHRVLIDHPLSSHVTLCPGVEDTARQFRADFRVKALKFDTKVNKAHALDQVYSVLTCGSLVA
jgi:hypothetical protein